MIEYYCETCDCKLKEGELSHWLCPYCGESPVPLKLDKHVKRYESARMQQELEEEIPRCNECDSELIEDYQNECLVCPACGLTVNRYIKRETMLSDKFRKEMNARKHSYRIRKEDREYVKSIKKDRTSIDKKTKIELKEWIKERNVLTKTPYHTRMTMIQFVTEAVNEKLERDKQDILLTGDEE